MPSAAPLSLTQLFRKNQLIVGSGFRAYFAPFDQVSAVNTSDTSVGPKMIDLSTGPFTTATIPAGFFDLGWIKDAKYTPQSKIGQVRSGYRGAVRVQYRGEVGEQLEFKFREYGRMQYKLGYGTNVLNLLSGTSPSPNLTGPVSASGATAYPVASGTFYQVIGGVATLQLVTASGFAVNDWIVCDVDYDPSTYGLVGDASTPIFKNAVTDIDYIRKNSDYVARVTAVNGNTLTLDQPFVGGGGLGNVTPQAGSKVQKIIGWAAREGGSFISEWSGMLLMDTVDAAQIVLYYPHLSIMQNRDGVAAWAIENIGTTDLGGHEIDAIFNALAYDDPIDGETVVRYSAFYPRPKQNVAI